MKQAKIVLWMVVVIMAGGLAIAHAAEKQGPHNSMMEMLLQQLKAVLNPNHVLGDAVDFDGTKVIPIVRMGFALSARPPAAQQSEDEEDEEDDDNGEERDHSAGAGLQLRSFLAPQALLVVTKTGDVRVIGLSGGKAWRERAERTERAERPEGARDLPPAPK